MELEDLKNIWQQGDPFKPRQEKEIVRMLKGSSRSIINKLRRNIWLELVLTFAAWMVLLYYSFKSNEGAMKWALISFLVLFLGYIIYYIKKLRILNQFEARQENIRTHLQSLIHDLDAYLKFYRRSYTLLYPTCFVLVLLFVVMDYGVEGLLYAFTDIRVILFMSFIAIIFIVSLFWFTNWYLRKLYGNHLEKLRKLLEDIQANEA